MKRTATKRSGERPAASSRLLYAALGVAVFAGYVGVKTIETRVGDRALGIDRWLAHVERPARTRESAPVTPRPRRRQVVLRVDAERLDRARQRAFSKEM